MCLNLHAWILIGLMLPSHAAAQTADTRRSGFEDMGASTQAMQRDDAQNPAMLWVQAGAQQWARVPQAGATGGVTTGKSCASCHGAAIAGGAISKPPVPLQSVAARYPAWDAVLGKPVNLSQRINVCRQRHQGLAALPSEHEDLLALDSWLGHAERGQKIGGQGAGAPDDRLAPWQKRGEQIFMQRVGQLNLSCAQCHDQRAGLKLAGSTIPQGHATGYPAYRLEWQSLGSLPRRLRGCMTGVRAEPFAAWSDEMTALEIYLANRAMGMLVETPAVRP